MASDSFELWVFLKRPSLAVCFIHIVAHLNQKGIPLWVFQARAIGMDYIIDLHEDNNIGIILKNQIQFTVKASRDR
jgi:hypothetical protein